jgi:hypothetical protein
MRRNQRRIFSRKGAKDAKKMIFNFARLASWRE